MTYFWDYFENIMTVWRFVSLFLIILEMFYKNGTKSFLKNYVRVQF